MGGYYNGHPVGVPYLAGAKHNMIRSRGCFFPPLYKIRDYWTRWHGEPNNSASLLILKWDTSEIYNWEYECARDGWEPRSLAYRFADELHDGRTIVPIENYVRNPLPVPDGEPYTASGNGVKFEHDATSVKITNEQADSEGWIMTEVTLPAGDYALRARVVSVDATYGSPQGPIISAAVGDDTIAAVPYEADNTIHACAFSLPRRRKVVLRLHANTINGTPHAATRFDHIMCMSAAAWTELADLGLGWFDANTVSDPTYQEAS